MRRGEDAVRLTARVGCPQIAPLRTGTHVSQGIDPSIFSAAVVMVDGLAVERRRGPPRTSRLPLLSPWAPVARVAANSSIGGGGGVSAVISPAVSSMGEEGFSAGGDVSSPWSSNRRELKRALATVATNLCDCEAKLLEPFLTLKDPFPRPLIFRDPRYY